MEVFWAAFGGGAASGLVALIAAVIVEFWRDRKDRPKLKVDGTILLVARGTFETGVSTYFSVNAGNLGRHRVRITGYGFQLKDSDDVLQVRPPRFAEQSLPCDLEAGQSFTGWVLLDELGKALSKSGRNAADIRRVWVRDAVGRNYFGEIANHGDLVREVSKRQEEARGTEAAGE